jgi:hypothetical protein
MTLTGLDCVQRHTGRLQARGAVAGDCGTRQPVESEPDRDDACHVHALFATGEAAAEHEVVEQCRIECGYGVESGAHHCGGEVVGPELDEGALVGPPDR